MKNITIVKENGEKTLYNSDKLKTSLSRAGASDYLVQEIISEIEKKLYDGITTKEIYKKAFDNLKTKGRDIAARYKLKKAIMELGPTGYPFEKFVGALLSFQGYTVEVGVVENGFCVTHEVDVVAEKEDQRFMIECKYHSSFNTICNVKVPLYIQSRFLDLKKYWEIHNGHNHKFHQGWVVTNTRFSSDAIQFGECVGLNLLSWDYPKKGSLKELISLSGLYPITCLNTLTKSEKQSLLKENIVLCKELCKNSVLLDKFGISALRKNKILKDARSICNTDYL